MYDALLPDGARVRFRVDGRLQEHRAYPAPEYEAVVAAVNRRLAAARR